MSVYTPAGKDQECHCCPTHDIKTTGTHDDWTMFDIILDQTCDKYEIYEANPEYSGFTFNRNYKKNDKPKLS